MSGKVGEELPFFLSSEDTCPYWMDRVEQKLFTKLTGVAESDDAINSFLTMAGFRRSMDILYRPYCPNCRACIPVRLNQTLFKPSRSQKKLIKKNADLVVECVPARATPMIFDLFRSYIHSRHAESDMAQMDWLSFQNMIEGSAVAKFLIVVRTVKPRRVVGCMLADDVGNGYSAVYSFFDPSETRRSLGTFLIICLINEARRQNKEWIYLGYWIEGLQKMAYKASFRPLERIKADALFRSKENPQDSLLKPKS